MNTYRDTWRLLRPHLAPRVWVFAAVLALAGLSAIGPATILLLFIPLWKLLFTGEDLVPAEAMGGLADRVDGFVAALRDRLVDAAGGGLDEDQKLAALLVVACLGLGLAALSAAAQFAFTCTSRWLALRLVVDLRQDLAKHLAGLSMRYHQRRRFGDLLSRISADVTTVLQTVQQVMVDLIQEPAAVLAAFGLAVAVSPTIALGMIVAIPLLAVPVAYLSRKIRKRSKKSLDTLGASVQTLTQMFQGIRTVKAYRAEERELGAFREVNEGYLRHSMRMVKTMALTNSWTVLFSLGGIALLIVPVGWLRITGRLDASPPLLGVLVMQMSQVYSHMKRVTRTWARVQESLGASSRLLEILDEPADVVEATDPVRLRGLGDGVRLRGVSFSYRDEDEPALRDVDLEIRPGETLALVGPSGAGKSTLADLLCRFIDPSQGAILVDGHDLRSVSRDDWCSLFAHVDQVPFLFHASIRDNILYGRPGASREEVEAAARAANIHEFIASLPDGYETDVADAGTRLSGGQRQRIVIARALLRDAPLLILDEATSALDSESEAAVQKALDRLMENRTVVVIAHRLSTIRHADRIAVLEGGRLAELGTHAELLEQGGTYARLHGLQHGARDVLVPAPKAEPASRATDR